jgi:glutamine amidotransferase
MKKPLEAVIVEAGMGNLGNLVRALEHVGATPRITADPAEIAAARCLLLPGVGAFAATREAIRGGIETAIREALGRNGWLLGICVGFQILFEQGEEFGVTDGLGLLPGRVTRLPEGVPVPHIGWNRLHHFADHPLLDDMAGESGKGRYVYFAHSYAPEGVPDELCLARCTHGREFPAVVGRWVGRSQVLGTQFHPERSGAVGLQLLQNFVEMAHFLPFSWGDEEEEGEEG